MRIKKNNRFVGATGGSPALSRPLSLDLISTEGTKGILCPQAANPPSTQAQSTQARATGRAPLRISPIMQINPTLPLRRSLRLKGYDYSQAGVYFVTLCAQEKICLFGEIVNDEMLGNELGTIVAAEWEKSAEIRSEIELGPYVIMPNHFHGIILIMDPDWSPVPNQSVLTPLRRGDRRVARSEPVPALGPQCDRGVAGNPLPPTHPGPGDQPVAPTRGPQPGSVGALMAGFKAAVTKRINTDRHQPGTPVWQRNYYEHVIRDEDDYHRIIEYISTNPQRWLEDSLHPSKVSAITKSKRNTSS